MSQILEEYDEKAIKKIYKRRFFLKVLGFFLIVVIFGIYVGTVLFGSNSLDVLLNLQTQKEYLKTRVVELKSENAKLQKQYFELRQLDPESK